MLDQIQKRRLEVLEEHFRSVVEQEFDRTLATFNGRPHYEIMATGQIYDGDDYLLAYHRKQRTALPDQRHENVRLHFADNAVVAEFDLLGTNLGEFYGMTPTGKSFRVPVIAAFFFEEDRIVNERVYLDSASLLTQLGRRRSPRVCHNRRCLFGVAGIRALVPCPRVSRPAFWLAPASR
jgi:steroid delta-isomerase-like uncharacterized protein